LLGNQHRFLGIDCGQIKLVFKGGLPFLKFYPRGGELLKFFVRTSVFFGSFLMLQTWRTEKSANDGLKAHVSPPD
jgi:hypothetical protein